VNPTGRRLWPALAITVLLGAFALVHAATSVESGGDWGLFAAGALAGLCLGAWVAVRGRRKLEERDPSAARRDPWRGIFLGVVGAGAIGAVARSVDEGASVRVSFWAAGGALLLTASVAQLVWQRQRGT
jgi:protein-S-isoprenylcysteine O-methyltransferase Ste14